MEKHAGTNVRLKPPCERAFHMADAATMGRFKASAKTSADKVGLAEQMLRRNPDRLGSYLLLAEHAPAPVVRNVYLAQAISVRYRV